MTTPEDGMLQQAVHYAVVSSRKIGERHELLMEKSRALIERVSEKLPGRMQDD